MSRIKLPSKRLKKPVFNGVEWNTDTIAQGWEIIDTIAREKYQWEGYNVQFEIVTAEQLLSKEVNIGMPIMYNHYSLGRDFLQIYDDYQKGKHGLAYEMIINTDPSICYILETNTQMMHLLVTAHAAVGHNHFFKYNYLFKNWTTPNNIVNYLLYAKDYFHQCEEQYGIDRVEAFISSIEYLQSLGYSKVKTTHKTKAATQKNKENVVDYIESSYDPILHGSFIEYRKKILANNSHFGQSIWLTSDNLLLSLATYSSVLESWQREVIVILSKIAQYFYPQMQDKMLNEGFASFAHHTLMYDLYDYGYIDNGYMLEFSCDHCAVLYAPDFLPEYGLVNINPYYLGFNLFKDIQRMAQNPTEEDKRFNSYICGQPWRDVVQDVVENYRDESAIRSFLSPHLIRKLKLLNLYTTNDLAYFEVTGIQKEEDYVQIRDVLAKQLSIEMFLPELNFKLLCDPVTGFASVDYCKIELTAHNKEMYSEKNLDILSILVARLGGFKNIGISINGKEVVEAKTLGLSI